MFTDVCDCLSHLVGHVLEQVTLCWPTPVAKWCPEGRRKLVLEVIFFGVSSVSTISTCLKGWRKGESKTKKGHPFFKIPKVLITLNYKVRQFSS